MFKYSSPTFLSITLMGCAVMYTEVVFIFKSCTNFQLSTFEDGGDLPIPEHLPLRADQVDQAPWLLHHLHCSTHENMEVNIGVQIDLRKH